MAIIRQQVCHHQGQYFYIEIHAIHNKPWAPVVTWELLKPFGFSFIQIHRLLTHRQSSGTMAESASHRLYVDRKQWIITPHTPPNTQAYQINGTEKYLTIPPHTLNCTQSSRKQYTIVANKKVAALDFAQLSFPLIVRKWQPGDTFYPLGMQQRKKLSDFFIDHKIPRPLKAQTWVVTSKGTVVWVMGYRIDNRFKVTDRTERVYEICLE